MNNTRSTLLLIFVILSTGMIPGCSSSESVSNKHQNPSPGIFEAFIMFLEQSITMNLRRFWPTFRFFSRSREDDAEKQNTNFIQYSIPENAKTYTHFSLSCVMFKTYGCNMECAITGIAYNQKVTGSCPDSTTCKCIIPEDASLDALWTMKFDDTSKVVLGQIKADSQLRKKVNAALREPFKTPGETKEKLKSILDYDQYKKLIVKKSEVSSYLLENGKPRRGSVKYYVTNVIYWDAYRFRYDFFPDYDKARDRFEKSLQCAQKNNNEAIFNNLVTDARRTEITQLIEIVDRYSGRGNFKKVEGDLDNPSIRELIAAFVINEMFVKPLTGGKKPPEYSSTDSISIQNPIKPFPVLFRSKMHRKLP